MTRLNVNDARCVALFASGLPRPDAPVPEALAAVISRTVRQFGIAGCAGRMAQEFGDHPEAAASRMRWIRQLIGEAFAPSARPVLRDRRDRRDRMGGWPSASSPGLSAPRPPVGSTPRAA